MAAFCCFARAEHNSKGANPRYVVTNIQGELQQPHDRLYCARGGMENRVKEQQLDFFADRISTGSPGTSKTPPRPRTVTVLAQTLTGLRP